MSSTYSGMLDSLSVTDRRLLADALGALLRERSCALQIAVEVASTKGHRTPSVDDFGLPNILRMTRLFTQPESTLDLREA
ncbi:hypothetical protein AWB74_05912 [Caballeronia arvi]|jgi:hypothetical protein|uniref:Uncharacterized protein n=1 Tax=Caballeronia arvi TaxID=1777135 RepID=A0A158KJH9_9BURK|nr:hypothetical protein [Caballeronia arvi]SAL81302.1 hypothetical protein AWB74_05912 [Caballeronia arvi]